MGRKSILVLGLVWILFALIFIVVVDAKRIHTEKYYQEQWAEKNGGRLEVVLESGARCDILTESNAIEVDFADKWAEGLGQALHYASQTGKRAAVLLIMESRKDDRYLDRLMSTIEYFKLPVDVLKYEAY